MKKNIFLYVTGVLMILVLAFLAGLLLNIGVESRKAHGTTISKPRLDLPDDIPWDKIPWHDFPENFPWDEVPWEEFPKDTEWENLPWEEVPWDKIPEDAKSGDIPWDKIPWESLPEDFSYENVPFASVPWEKLPKDIPYGNIQWDKIPWESLPEDFPYESVPFASVPWEKLPKDIPYGDIKWDKIPWDSLPEDFPYESVPWDNLPDDYPWTQPETGCKHKYSDWETVKEATCGEPGVETRKCDVCENVETRVIPPTKKHKFDDDGECSVCHVQRLKLKSRSAEEVYGGAPLKCEEYDVLEGKIKEGHIVKGVYKKLDSVGVADNIFTVTLTDAAGKDVSASYIIEYEYGTLRLMQRKITVTTGSASKKYDGTELICTEYFIDGLAQGDRAELTFGEGQTERGRRENVASVKIYNGDGEDVTANYAIETIFGILSVE